MARINKYEKIYQEDPNACGSPFEEFVEFFNHFEKSKATVLDLGCGQGRDALFISRLGHHVTGVDLSETGVTQMLEAAQQENLKIEGSVADVVAYEINDKYDVVILDRVLHLLSSDEERLLVLQKAFDGVCQDGHLLIADTPSNKRLIQSFFDGRESQWELVKRKKGFLFVRKKNLN